MRRDESLPVVLHEREEIGALLRREIDLPNAKEEDGVEVVEVTDIELLAAGDAGPRRERDRMLRDQLRVGTDECVVLARLPAEPFDGRNGVRNGIVLVTIPHVCPGEHVLARRRRRRFIMRPRAGGDGGNDRRTRDQPDRKAAVPLFRRAWLRKKGYDPFSRRGHFVLAGSANATIFEPGAAPRKLPPPAA